MATDALLDRLSRALAGRYTVVRELGHGGMAAVYLGTDLKLGRQVAIKVLPPATHAYLGPERFRREILVGASLKHLHIVPVFDADEADGFLYYVMEYVEGESLEDRLAREGPLPLEEALRLTTEIGEALQYAHEAGVIHRDIKPANILLSHGHALVSDFGIAKLIEGQDDAASPALTDRGAALGTPEYMSPEQASAARRIDARADVYGLAATLYAMLAGEPPFTGPSGHAVLARVLSDPPRPIRTVRPNLPPHVACALERGLAKEPADRYPTAQAFVDALAAQPGTLLRPSDRQVAWMVIGGLATLALISVLAGRTPKGAVAYAATLDTARYVILPFSYHHGVGQLDEAERLQDVLAHWSGVAVVDPFQLNDALARHPGQELSSEGARLVAGDLGAGRYLRGEVSRIGDSIRVYAGLYAASHGGSLVRDGVVKFGVDLAQADSAFVALGDHLLFGSVGPAVARAELTGTTSRPARQAYVQGQAAIDRWDLAAADSAFAAAGGYDPHYAQAFLWLAQVRFWNAGPRATWQSAAERAAAGRDRLSARDRLLSDALLALGRGAVEQACIRWARLTALAPHDFAAWYGLGDCLRSDNAVLRDRASPSGWRFRSSYHQATQAYRQAFLLLPSIHRSVHLRSYGWVRQLLLTSGSQLRAGHALPPDTTTFAGQPVWQGDTLALVPYPVETFHALRLVPEAADRAIRHQREVWGEIARGWVTAFPQSPDAVEALAIALDMLGDPSAIDTVGRARALARTPEERVRTTSAAVWLRVRFGAPSDAASLAIARALADSVLRMYPPPDAPEPLLLASLAALTGRADLAASYGRQPARHALWAVPAPLAETAFPLLTFAALGGPPDSLRALEARVDSAIDNAVVAPRRQDVRLQWLARAATLAFPDYRFRSIPKLVATGDYLLDAQAAWLRGDTAAVRRMFAHLKAARRFVSPAEVTLDGLWPEARLLAALGDDQQTIAWIDPTLSRLRDTSPESFMDPAPAGALVRTMILRAELAARLGDRGAAARWARAVTLLWSNADPYVQPVVARLRRLGG